MQPEPSGVMSAVSGVFTACVSLVVLAGGLGTAWMASRFVAIFVDLEVELPAFTRMLVGVPGWAWATGSALLVGFLVLKERLRSVPVRLLFSGIVLLITLLLGILVILGLFLPLVTVIQALEA